MRLFLLVLVLFSPPASAMTEADYVNAWCANGRIEYKLPDKARVDCLTSNYAIEFDYAKKWAESIGQALYYSSQTGRNPGIVLIVGPGELRFVERLFEAIQKGGVSIRVWFVEKQY